MSDERDRLAEEWLIARHSPDWYLGDATAAEWDMAYAATDRKATGAGGAQTAAAATPDAARWRGAEKGSRQPPLRGRSGGWPK